mmetsp:Transcript_21880/g.55151  ORF Transcript_21880/g.55151 Transcript_21880/m.55151 type:complete len:200 (+) Transcript_21880:271-870(+)
MRRQLLPLFRCGDKLLHAPPEDAVLVAQRVVLGAEGAQLVGLARAGTRRRLAPALADALRDGHQLQPAAALDAHARGLERRKAGVRLQLLCCGLLVPGGALEERPEAGGVEYPILFRQVFGVVMSVFLAVLVRFLLKAPARLGGGRLGGRLRVGQLLLHGRQKLGGHHPLRIFEKSIKRRAGGADAAGAARQYIAVFQL